MTGHRRVLFAIGITIILFFGCGAERRRHTEGLEQSIRSILELPAYEQIYRDVIYIDREKTFLLIRTMYARVLFSIDIRVQAGIDLSEGIEIVPGKNKRTITIRLPDPKILLVDADESTIHQYFIRESGGEIERMDYYDEIDRVKSEILNDSIEREILLKAEASAQRMIEGLLEAAGYEEVRFASL